MEIVRIDGRKKKTVRKLLFFLLFSGMVFLNAGMAQAKTKPLSGKDKNGNEWVYDKKTKTLTFSGTADLEYFEMDGHRPEPNWWCWKVETEHLVIESGITGLPGEEFCEFFALKTVRLPDTVTHIGDLVFYGCRELENVEMPDTITSIGLYAFGGCRSWKNARIPEKVTVIGEGAFASCHSIEELTIPDTVKKIGDNAFANCVNMESIRLPKNLKTIRASLFCGCKKLSHVKLPDSVEKIEMNAFSRSGITSIVIPENVTELHSNKEGKKYGNRGLFEDCKKLETITIRSKKLKHIYKGAFEKLKKDVVIKVPKSKLKKYKKMFREAGLNKKVKVKAIGGKEKPFARCIQ